jgi:hypothetical protein
MKNHGCRLLLALFFFLLLVTAATAKEQKFTIYYSNALHGEIEPCG